MTYEPSADLAAIGTHATVHYPEDSYGAVVEGVGGVQPHGGDSMRLVMLTPVAPETGHEPVRRNGDFPVWDHEYSDEEVAALRSEEACTIHLGDDHRWRTKEGAEVTFGRARYYRDMSR